MKPPPRHIRMAIVEPLTASLPEVIRAKALAAYKKALVPVFVEHGGLYVQHLNEFPGPLVKLLWEKVGDGICKLIPAEAPRRAYVVQMVAHCDGRRITVYEGRVDGETRTLGEMDPPERLARSAGGLAYAALKQGLGI